MKTCTDVPGGLPAALNADRRLDEPVLAAGHLRQGRAPSALSMATGWVLVELLRRPSRALPRQFVLAVTATSVVAYRAVGGGGDSAQDPYVLRVQDREAGRWPRTAVAIEGLGAAGSAAVEATLVLDGARVPVSRPRTPGDPNTDLLLDVLSGAAAPGAPPPVGPSRPRERFRLDVLDAIGVAL